MFLVFIFELPLFISKFVENGCQGEKVVKNFLFADLYVQVTTVIHDNLVKILKCKKKIILAWSNVKIYRLSDYDC